MRALLLPVALSACSDQRIQTVAPDPQPPVALIVSHADGDQVRANEPITLQATFADPDNELEELSLSWTVGGAPLAQDTDARGSTSELTVDAPEGAFTARFQVLDPDGGVGEDAVTLEGLVEGDSGESGPPAVAISAPADGAAFALGETVTFAASVSDPDEAPTALSLAWISSLDGSISAQGADSTGRAQFTAADLSAGEHTLTVTVTDGDGDFASDLVVFSISGPPWDPEVSIFPADPYTTDDLVAQVMNLEDGVDYGFAWTVDGALSANTTDTVSASETVRGAVWAVEVVAWRGDEESGVGADSVTVLNSPPAIEAVSLSPADPTTEEVLVAAVLEEDVSDADGDPVTLTYAWTVDGASAGASEVALDGRDWFDAGETVAVEVTPTDGLDDGAPARAEVVVAGSAPGAPGVTITPTSPIEGEDDLLCAVSTPADDADGDALTYTFTWSVDGADYPGADTGGWSGPESTTWTDDTAPADDTLAGEIWTCEVVADDGSLTGPAASDSVTVGEEALSACPDGDCGVRFDGSNDYVLVPHDVSLDGGASPLTVEAWIYYDQIASGCMTHARKGTASSASYDYWHHKNISPDDSLYWAGYGGYSVVTFSAVSPLVWFHYAGVHDPATGEARTYLNGVLAETASVYATPATNTDDLIIGLDWDGGCPMDGVIDELRISSVVRYSANFTPPGPFSSDGDTMALYHFDEYTGATAYDSSGNGNHGALVGATWTSESP